MKPLQRLQGPRPNRKMERAGLVGVAGTLGDGRESPVLAEVGERDERQALSVCTWWCLKMAQRQRRRAWVSSPGYLRGDGWVVMAGLMLAHPLPPPGGGDRPRKRRS